MDKDYRALMKEKKYNEALTLLDDNSATFTVPVFREAWKRFLQKHAQWVESARQAEANRNLILDKKMPDWKTEGWDGKTYSSKDFDGKVLVLDFWFKQCGWCLVAMPEIKRIAETYKDRPVQVLGMNTDKKNEDAEEVIQKFALPYPNLQAAEITKSFRIESFPTVIVVDRKGVVRFIHSGYSADLFEELRKEIDPLLQNP